MTLEHRVLVVEQELQILKSQIQITLLTIQEHLLKNTYPTLRTKDAGVMQPAAEAQSSIAQSSSVKRISIPEIESEVALEDASSFPAPQVKKVRSAGLTGNAPPVDPYQLSAPSAHRAYDEPLSRDRHEQVSASPARGGNNAPRFRDQNTQFSAPGLPSYDEARDAGERRPLAQARTQAADLRLWFELDKWVDQKVKEVGIQRTRELISLFEGPEHDLLMQVVEIYEKRPEVVRPRSVPARQRTVPTIAPQTHSIAEEWQKFANTNKMRNATCRPFGEHQELALRLIADILGASQTESDNSQSNGSSNH